MNSRENGKRQDSNDFIAESVDEQIESRLTRSVPGQQPGGARLLRDLVAMSREDTASLDRIWQRLSSHQTFHNADHRIDDIEQTGQDEASAAEAHPLTPFKRRLFRQRLGLIAAAACMLLLVGSLAVVLNLGHNLVARHPGTGGTAEALCTPTDKNTTAPAPVVYAEKAKQSGLYVAGGQGIYRFDVQGGQAGHLQPLWVFKMNACTSFTPTTYPNSLSHGNMKMFTPRITTGAVVGDNMVFFDVAEESGAYLYALDSQDGALAWKAKVGVSGTPLVLANLVVVATTDNAGNPMIMALDARHGTIHWSHSYATSITNQSEGLGAVGDDRVFVSASNTIFALDGTSGKQVWSSDIESGQIISGTRYFDGTLYVTASFSCYNCEVLPGTSAAYAFDPATGNQLWESQKVAGYPSPPTEAQGVVYFGAIDGSVHALRASDGQQLWQSHVTGEVRGAPDIADGLVVVTAGPFLDPTQHGTSNGEIVALAAAHGDYKESIAFPNMGINDYSNPLAVTNGYLYIGTATFVLYSVNAHNGRQIQQYALQEINGGTFFELSPYLTLVP
ncbi:MAG TPA: PQQ-binding-like beta-propeller repeat protein [Ktedonobacteraceae bacterium]|nr:PQQ-binding-like beta-propeller repeat protein [Ktedonobacteraceae bacterium]